MLSGAWYLNVDSVDGTLSIQVGGSTVASFPYPLVLDLSSLKEPYMTIYTNTTK